MATPNNIVCTGWATKRVALKKNWKRRYFVLRSDFTLSYYKDGWTPSSKPQVCLCGVIIGSFLCADLAGCRADRAHDDLRNWGCVLCH